MFMHPSEFMKVFVSPFGVYSSNPLLLLLQLRRRRSLSPEVDATSALPSSVLSPGDEGSLSLASSALGGSVSLDWFWIPLVDRWCSSGRRLEVVTVKLRWKRRVSS
ncbi:hypothetical protein F2Q69_00046476 [Brassica cretica]|uniref:Uncharacterized protein n=1 Tax=Brassica cretica TaxID=69181 RepID=A0A8S9PZA3_BRACR|nr:hypothetical protein F2Q69_00046476 [Brassica cretica]